MRRARRHAQAVFDGEELDVVDLVVGARLAATLGPHRLLVLANHGLLTVGATVGQAVEFFVLAEHAPEVEIKAGAEARLVSDTAAAAVRRSVGSASNGDVVFTWLCRTRLAGGDRGVTQDVVAL